MATRLGAGKYVFAGNLPMGCYDLTAVSGYGLLFIEAKDDRGRWSEDTPVLFGVQKEYAKTYNGLSLPEGRYFRVTGNVIFEITRTKMIEIE